MLEEPDKVGKYQPCIESVVSSTHGLVSLHSTTYLLSTIRPILQVIMISNQIMRNHTFKQLCGTPVMTACEGTCRIAKAKSSDQIQARNERQPLFSCTFAAAFVNRSQRTSVAMLRADWAI